MMRYRITLYGELFMKKNLASKKAIAWLVFIFLCVIGVYSIVNYQETALSCKPNCAGANLAGVVLFRPYLYKHELGMMVIRDVDFSQANLADANLRGVHMRKNNFQQANLSQAILRDADLAWSNLNKSNLIKVDMSRANLFDAELQGADLTEANLTNAYLLRADLSGSDLTGTVLTEARYNSKTKWPERFDPAQAGAVYEATNEYGDY